MRVFVRRLAIVAFVLSLFVPGMAWALDYVPGEVIIVYKDVSVDVETDVSDEVYALLAEDAQELVLNGGSDNAMGDEKDPEVGALALDDSEPELELPDETTTVGSEASQTDGVDAILDIQSTEEVIDGLGFETTEDLGATADTSGEQAVLAEVPAGMEVEEAVALLEDVPGVDYVQPNYEYELIEPVEVQALASSYGIDDPDGVQAFLTRAKIREAWMYARTEAKVSVAVIDSGCNLEHEDLNSVLDTLHARDFSTDVTEGIELTGDDFGHGTHVCGIVAAEANNGIGIAGASYNARVIPVRVLDSKGSTTSAKLALGMRYVASLKSTGAVENLRVANISAGFRRTTESDENWAVIDEYVHYYVQLLKRKGILVVCAGGNSSASSAIYPSDYDESLSVMNLTEDGLFAGSNDYNDAKDIAAVGFSYSTYKGSPSSYVNWSGTSMAAPVVSGVAALVWSTNPDLTVDQVRDILLATTSAVPAGGDSPYSSKASQRVGSVNALEAVKLAINEYGGQEIGDYVEVEVPDPEDFVYDGKEHQSFAYPSRWMTLKGDVSATEVGTYTFTATLRTDQKQPFRWADGDENVTRTFTWHIEPATLTATYEGGYYKMGSDESLLPTTVTVTGFVNGETAQTAADYVAPTVDITDAQKSTDGEYLITPTDGSARNYEFEYVTGTLVVGPKDVVSLPIITNYAYDKTEHVGVATGEGYTLEGTTRATDVGSYTVTATLDEPNTSVWADATSEPKTITWTISPFDIANASWDPLPSTVYTGKAQTPLPAISVLGSTLEQDIDYTLTYADNTKVGTATVTLEGTGSFTGTVEIPFDITPATLTATYAGGTIYAGGKAPTTVNVTGFVNGETISSIGKMYAPPTVSITDAQRKTPGSYSIKPSGGAAANYKFAYKAGTLVVKHVKATSLVLDKTSLTLKPAATSTLKATISPSNVTDKTLTWKSSNTKVAKVSSAGKVTVVGAGTATITCTTSANAGSKKATCSVKVAIPAATVAYRAYVQKDGWQSCMLNGKSAGTTGRSLRMEAIKIRLLNQPCTGSIAYRTCYQGYGWEKNWRKDGKISGTTGKSKRVGIIQVKLTGNMAKYYDVYYRVNVQNFGWMGWAKNGAWAGTAGYSYRIEGIQIRLVPKGGAAPGSTANAYRKK